MGVRPILVSIDTPFSMAHALLPEPKWKIINRRVFRGLLRCFDTVRHMYYLSLSLTNVMLYDSLGKIIRAFHSVLTSHLQVFHTCVLRQASDSGKQYQTALSTAIVITYSAK